MKLTAAPESLFWYWVGERHHIYLKRMSGEPKPWTRDPILRHFKFTNVFRQLDVGTRWLTEHFAKHKADPSELLIFNATWYRLFNWTGTAELLGWQTAWRPVVVKRRLHVQQKTGAQVFTGAHIVWGEAGQPKIDSVVDFCTSVWKTRRALAMAIEKAGTLEGAFYALTSYRGIGGFIGYEIVSDLRHTRLLEQAPDINAWANVGPGALRGLRRLYPGMPVRDGLGRMVGLLEKSKIKRAKWVPEMELRDIEHSLCEFDKHCRVKFGEGRPRSRYPGI